MKQLCGFDITERAQTELHRKGAAFELVRLIQHATSFSEGFRPTEYPRPHMQVYPDIKKVNVRVRNMNMILLAEASTLHLQSVQQWSKEQCTYYLSHDVLLVPPHCILWCSDQLAPL